MTLPTCSRCSQPSVLVVCRECHTCMFTRRVGYGEKGKDGVRYPIRECMACHQNKECGEDV